MWNVAIELKQFKRYMTKFLAKVNISKVSTIV